MIIFLAGVHGVGKTFLATYSAENLKIKHTTASQLIQSERQFQSWSINKNVDQIESNQSALISALKRLQENEKIVLLDGHFVLRDANNLIIEIEEKVFSDLSIDKVFLIENDPKIIRQRLVNRGDSSWTLQEINAFAFAEKSHAISVTSSLKIPFEIIQAPTQDEFLKTLRQSICVKKSN